MRDEVVGLSGEQSLFSSELSPGPAQKKLALFLVLVLVTAYFLVSGPFAGVQLGQNTWFVPAYVAAMFVNDLVTAILLFAQYSILRSRGAAVDCKRLCLHGAYHDSMGYDPCGRPGAERSDWWCAKPGMALYFLAWWFCLVRTRLRYVEGCGIQEAILAGQRARGDRPERDFDGSHRVGPLIYLHRRRRTIAPGFTGPAPF